MIAQHTHTTSLDHGPLHAADPRVAEALAEEGLEYRLFDGGDFVLNLPLNPGVDSFVGVTSTTARIHSREYRRVFSVGCSQGEEGWGGHLWSTLLRLNGDYAMGGWEIASTGDEEVALFSIAVPADAPAGELHAALLFTAINTQNLRVLLQNRRNLN